MFHRSLFWCHLRLRVITHSGRDRCAHTGGTQSPHDSHTNSFHFHLREAQNTHAMSRSYADELCIHVLEPLTLGHHDPTLKTNPNSACSHWRARSAFFRLLVRWHSLSNVPAQYSEYPIFENVSNNNANVSFEATPLRRSLAPCCVPVWPTNTHG